MNKVRSRIWIVLILTGLVAIILLWAFWPRSVLIDSAEVKRGYMSVTLNEEGRTRVNDSYIVSTPIAGKLLRVEVTPGDSVIAGKTVIARMLPANPSVLDIRTREQTLAAIKAAEASVKAAEAALDRSKADLEYAKNELERERELTEEKFVSQANLELAIQRWRSAEAGLEEAKQNLILRNSILDIVRAQLINVFSGADKLSSVGEISIFAPITGEILTVMEESEKTLQAGHPIMDIGDVSNDLEITADFLSTDVVKIAEGDRVNIKDWGGENDLQGHVNRIYPSGFTKISALGVEEQRVTTVIKFDDPPQDRERLGHGYRVEVQVVIWESNDVLNVPSSSLFRKDEKWMVYQIINKRARLKEVKIGRDNGIQAEVIEGLDKGDVVILYPGSNLEDGIRVAQR